MNHNQPRSAQNIESRRNESRSHRNESRRNESHRSLHLEALESRTLLSAMSLLPFAVDGSQASMVHQSGTLAAGETQTWTVDLGSNQPCWFNVDTDATLNTLVTIGYQTSSGQTVTHTITANTWNKNIAATVAGTYNVSITSQNNTAGSYELTGIITGNSEQAVVTSQSLDSCFATITTKSLSAGSQASVCGSFDKGSGDTDQYTFTIANGSFGTATVYAPQSPDVKIELYRGTTRITQAVDNGNGLYTIPVFSNTTGSDTVYTLKLTGGNSLFDEDYALVVTRNGAFDQEPNNASGAGQDIIHSGAAGTTASSSSSIGHLSGGNYTVASIEAPNLSSNASFGETLAYDNGLLAAGVSSQGSLNAVHLYGPCVDGSADWQYLYSCNLPTECTSAGKFGSAIDLGNGYLAVGAPENTINGLKSGSVFVYQLCSSNYTVLTMPGAEDGALFGKNVVIENDWLFIQASNGMGQTVNSGTVYVWHLNNGVWTYVQKLTGDTTTSGAQFGNAIACDGQSLVISAPFDDNNASSDGSVVVYSLKNNQWSYAGKLGITLDDLQDTAGTKTSFNNALFGTDIDISGSTMVISATGTGYNNYNEGIVFFYTRADNGTWTKEDCFVNPASTDGVSQFGHSLDLEQNYLIVSSAGNEGNVYMYEYMSPAVTTAAGSGSSGQGSTNQGSTNQGTWTQVQKLQPEFLIGRNTSTVVFANNRIVAAFPNMIPSMANSTDYIKSWSGIVDGDYYRFNVTAGMSSAADVTYAIETLGDLEIADMDIYLIDTYGNRITPLTFNGITYSQIASTSVIGSIKLSTGSWPAGTYSLHVGLNSTATQKTGDYIVQIQGAQPVPLTAKLTNFTAEGYVNKLPDEFIYQFSSAIDLSTLYSGQMKVGTTQVALSTSNCRIIDGRTIAVSSSPFNPSEGNITATLSGSIKSLQGGTFTAVSTTFKFDKTAPTIQTASSLFTSTTGGVSKTAAFAQNTVVPQGDKTTIKITFSESMNLSDNVDQLAAMITLTRVATSEETSFTVTKNPDSQNQITLTIDERLYDGQYKLVLSDQFVDLSGQVLVTAQRTWLFYVNSGEPITLADTTASALKGSLAYSTTVAGTVSDKAEIDKFSLTLSKGDSISVYVVPVAGYGQTSATLQPSLKLEYGTVSESNSANAVGIVAKIENKVLSTAVSTDLTINVSCVGTNIGDYNVLVIINGITNVLNTSSGTAQSLGSSTAVGTATGWSQSMVSSSITNVLGNLCTDSTKTTSQETWYTITNPAANQNYSVYLDPISNTSANVELFQGGTAAGNRIAVGYTNDNGILVIDPVNCTGSTTLYVKVSGTRTAFQLTAVRNGILDQGTENYQPQSLQTSGVSNSYSPSAYGYVSSTAGTISTSNGLSMLTQSNTGTGSAIAVDGEWAVIGCNEASVDSQSTDQGSALVYRYVNGSWQLFTTLHMSTPQTYSNFGLSVAIEGDLIAVGASTAAVDGIQTGLVELFRFDGSEWTSVAVVTPQTGTSQTGTSQTGTPQTGMLFGAEVQLRSGWLAVGATNDIQNGSTCGSVYMYEITRTENGSGVGSVTAEFDQRILAGKTAAISNRDYNVSESFGSAIDIDGNYMIVGAPVDFVDNTGSAFVYHYDGNRWSLKTIIKPIDTYGGGIGTSVAIDGSTIAVSAPGVGTYGTVYMYKIDDSGTITKVRELTPSAGSLFGSKIALDNGQLTVIGYTTSDRIASGSWIYVQDRSGTWTQKSTLTLPKNILPAVAAYDSGIMFGTPAFGTVYTVNAANNSDQYTFKNTTAGTVSFIITTPSSTGGQFANGLAPSVAVYTSAGQNITSQFTLTSVAGQITFTSQSALAVDTYTLVISATTGTSGEYALYITSSTPTNASDSSMGTFQLEGITNGLTCEKTAYAQTKPAQIQVQFSASVNLQKLQTAVSSGKITINGTNVTGFTVIDGRTIGLTIPTTSSTGDYTVSISANSGLTDTRGRELSSSAGSAAASTATLTVDSTPVIITASSSNPVMKSITLTLAEPLNSAPEIGDFILTGAVNGPVEITSVSVSDKGSEYRVTIFASALLDDLYTLTIRTSHNAFADRAGNIPDGSNTEAGINDLTLQFTVDITGDNTAVQTISYSGTGFEPVICPGSLAYESKIKGYISTGDTDTFQVSVPAHNTLSLYVQASDGLTPLVNVSSDDSSTWQSLPGDTSKNGTIIYNISTGSVDQVFTIKLSGTDLGTGTNTSGAYVLTAMLNHQIERESFGKSTDALLDFSNDTKTKAENLAGWNTNLKSGTSIVAQAGVRGTIMDSTDADWYEIELTKSDWANFYLQTAKDMTLQLYSEDGTLITTGTSSADFAQVIENFVQTRGQTDNELLSVTFFLKVSGEAGSYDLLAFRNAGFNRSEGQTAVISHNGTYIGSLDSSPTGSSYYVIEDRVWSEELGRGSFLGWSVDIDDTTMIAGAPTANISQINGGYAVIYQFDGINWVESQTLTAPDSEYGDYFGYSVAVEGDLAAVAAVGKTTGYSQGQVYVYERIDGTWTLTKTLESASISQTSFGTDLQICNGMIIVGAPGISGEVVVYAKNTAGNWMNIQKISIDSEQSAGSYIASQVGASVAVDDSNAAGAVMVVGAPNSSYITSASSAIVSETENVGQAFVYRYNSNSNSWVLEATLNLADDSGIGIQKDALFGSHVAVNGDIIAVSAPGATYANVAGQVYLYQRNGSSWTLKQTLHEECTALAIDDNYIAVSNMNQVNSEMDGAYIYTYYYSGGISLYQRPASSGNVWTKIQSETPLSPQGGAFFGADLVFNNGKLVSSAIRQKAVDSNLVPYSGVIYVYDIANRSDDYKFYASGTTTVSIEFPELPEEQLDGVTLSYRNANSTSWSTVALNSQNSGSFSVATGYYYIRVTTESGSEYGGTYMMTVSNSQISYSPALTAAEITSSTGSAAIDPVNPTHPVELTVAFSEAIRPDYLTTEAVALTCGADVFHPAGIEVSDDGKTLSFTLPADKWTWYRSTTLTATLISADIVSLSGKTLEQAVSSSFTLPDYKSTMTVTPTVTPTAGSTVAPFDEGLTLTYQFTEAVVEGSITVDSFTVNAGGKNFSPASVSLSANRKTVSVVLPAENSSGSGETLYLSDKLAVTLSDQTLRTDTGKTLAQSHSWFATLQRECMTVTPTVVVTGETVSVTAKFDQALADGLTTEEVTRAVQLKVRDESGEYISKPISAGALAYNATSHQIALTMPQSELGSSADFQLVLDGTKLTGKDGQTIAGLTEGTYTIDFTSSTQKVEVQAIVNQNSIVAFDRTSTGEVDAANLGSSTSWLDEWSTFYVELWATASTSAVDSISMELTFDQNLFEPSVSNDGQYVFEAGTAFSTANGGRFTVENINGRYYITAEAGENLQNLETGLGTNGEYVYLGRIQFKPSATGTGVAMNVYDTAEAPYTRIAFRMSGLGTLADSTTANIDTVSENVEVWPVIYDTNDDNTVNMTDFIFFAQNFNKYRVEGTGSWYTDFDISGQTLMTDFILFAQNFNKSRSAASTVTYADGFMTNLQALFNAPAAAMPATELPVVMACTASSETTAVIQTNTFEVSAAIELPEQTVPEQSEQGQSVQALEPGITTETVTTPVLSAGHLAAARRVWLDTTVSTIQTVSATQPVSATGGDTATDATASVLSRQTNWLTDDDDNDDNSNVDNRNDEVITADQNSRLQPIDRILTDDLTDDLLIWD